MNSLSLWKVHLYILHDGEYYIKYFHTKSNAEKYAKELNEINKKEMYLGTVSVTKIITED